MYDARLTIRIRMDSYRRKHRRRSHDDDVTARVPRSKKRRAPSPGGYIPSLKQVQGVPETVTAVTAFGASRPEMWFVRAEAREPTAPKIARTIKNNRLDEKKNYTSVVPVRF